ncbi:MAG: hypothetical protein KatS3mg102_2325 [Planctomycetota bacterium]|nr:MAG: hypothetical protein KatS3mg102_2325 [Planctomycetota bacterium]
MANPAKSTVLLDASSMQRVQDPATTDRRLFDLVVESCGRFDRWPQAETE